MRPGIGVEIPGWVDIASRAELARWVEELGYASLTAAEIADPDAFVTCALAAAATSRIDLGTCIAQIGPRTIPALAASAASVENLAPGRFTLGIGVSTEAIIRGWHGLDWKPPLASAGEAIPTLRGLLRGEPSRHDGPALKTKGYRLSFPTAPGRPPIWLAALSEGMLGVAAREADGVWLNLVPPHGVEWVQRQLSRVAPERTTSPGIGLSVLTHVTDDPQATFDEVRRMLAFYVAAPAYRRSMARHGYGDEMAAGEQALEARNWEGVVASVSDRLINEIALIGPPEVLRKGIESYLHAGVTVLTIACMNEQGMRPTLETVGAMIKEVTP